MAEVMLLTLLVALPLTLALSALIAWRYRSTVRKLMRLAPSPTDSDSPGVVKSELEALAMAPADRPVRLPASLPARERQLNLSLALCSVLISTSGAWLYLLVHQQEIGGITPLRLLLVSLVWCSPGLVLQALVLRWPLSRQLPVLLGIGITIFSPFAMQWDWRGALALSLAGGGIAVCGSLLALNHHQENWLRYRGLAEALKRQKYLFLTGTCPYDDASTAFPRLVSTCESLLSVENNQWSQEMSKLSEAKVAETQNS